MIIELSVLNCNSWNYITVTERMIDNKKNYLCWIAMIETIQPCENELLIFDRIISVW